MITEEMKIQVYNTEDGYEYTEILTNTIDLSDLTQQDVFNLYCVDYLFSTTKSNIKYNEDNDKFKQIARSISDTRINLGYTMGSGFVEFSDLYISGVELKQVEPDVFLILVEKIDSEGNYREVCDANELTDNLISFMKLAPVIVNKLNEKNIYTTDKKRVYFGLSTAGIICTFDKYLGLGSEDFNSSLVKLHELTEQQKKDVLNFIVFQNEDGAFYVNYPSVNGSFADSLFKAGGGTGLFFLCLYGFYNKDKFQTQENCKNESCIEVNSEENSTDVSNENLNQAVPNESSNQSVPNEDPNQPEITETRINQK